MAKIDVVTQHADQLVIKRLFGEYQRGVEQLIDGSEICP